MASGHHSPPADPKDRVVFEAPVYLSKLLHKQLHIFQYPVRPKATSVNFPVIRSRIKPALKEVELEVKLDTGNKNFDQPRAAYIAARVDGEDLENDDDDDEDDNTDKVYESGMVDKQVYLSGPYNVENPFNYAVGKFHNGELHLCPVKAILELQPSPSHGDLPNDELDKACEEKAAEEMEESSPEKICVKFQRQESERTKKLKMMTYSYYMKKRAEEKWIETQYYPASAQESELERQKVLCSHPRLEVAGLNVEKQQYLKSLVPYKPIESIPIPGPSVMVSVASLKPKHWLEKIRTLLLSAKIIQFGKLVSLVSDERNLRDVHCLLCALQTQAVMVRGNWIVRSEVMYPENTKSRYNGVPAVIMCRSRDYLLTLFNQYKYVGRVKFVNFVKIPSEEAKEMLMEIAIYHKNKGWDLKYPNDHDFMRRYPDITVHHQRILEERRNALDLMFKEIHEPSKSPEILRRQRKKSGRDTSVGMNENGSDPAAIPRRRKKSSSNAGNF
ncbi:DNA-directed RNA polymerase III subunit RPC5-like [Hetaerina americana]|uniref:DNA-directed RNA polymerase III subunit RPC5-like n=1 Tax=Hetaerina americana TaxID=62018 RepID=UPI003A7F2116